jgi:NhaP-type Na+/H+ or K+/H+ antiporter
MSFLWVSPFTFLFNYLNCFYLPSSSGNTIEQKNNFSEVVKNTTEIIISSFIENINNSTDVDDIPSDNKIYVHFTVSEILLFASVISATDTIAALTFIHEESQPKLFAILFGEGVVNDAVCIVLYRILREFTMSGREFTSGTPISMFGEFLKLAFCSFLVGLIIGCVCAKMLKFFLEKKILLNRTQEISIILFFAFISYTFSEELGLSPIVTLLFSGIFMSNYAFYNLSFQAREESSVVSRMLSNIAEAFVFTYLGLTLISSIQKSFCLSFIIIEFFVVLGGRIFAIFGLSYIIRLLNVKSFRMKTSQKGIMSCAGSIRGAIAFGLAISIETSNELHREIIVGSTLILVFFTTIVFGALMPIMINVMQKLDSDEENELLSKKNSDIILPSKQLTCEHFNFLHPNFTEVEVHKEKNIEVLKTRISYWLGHYWVEFDEMIIKPWLCYQWPWNYTDNMNVKKIILSSIHKYEQEEKNKTHFIRGITKKSSIDIDNNKENLVYDNIQNKDNNIESDNINSNLKINEIKNSIELNELSSEK